MFTFYENLNNSEIIEIHRDI